MCIVSIHLSKVCIICIKIQGNSNCFLESEQVIAIGFATSVFITCYYSLVDYLFNAGWNWLIRDI